MTEEQSSSFALEQLEHLLASQTAPKETAAILIESVLGEGGYVVPPASFMKGLRQICDRHGILLIFDECSRASAEQARGSPWSTSA